MQDKFTVDFELFLIQKHSKKGVQDLTKFEKYQITDWFYELPKEMQNAYYISFFETLETLLLVEPTDNPGSWIFKILRADLMSPFYEEQHEKKEYKTRNEAIEAGIQFLKHTHNS